MTDLNTTLRALIKPIAKSWVPFSFPLHEVIVFSKEGCHICEGVEAKVKALVQKSKEQGRGDFSLRVVDIRNDESIFKKYFLTIPVVRVDGIDIFSAEDIALVADRDKKLEAYFSKLR